VSKRLDGTSIFLASGEVILGLKTWEPMVRQSKSSSWGLAPSSHKATNAVTVLHPLELTTHKIHYLVIQCSLPPLWGQSSLSAVSAGPSAGVDGGKGIPLIPPTLFSGSSEDLEAQLTAGAASPFVKVNEVIRTLSPASSRLTLTTSP
jgi:hypothetical protein